MSEQRLQELFNIADEVFNAWKAKNPPSEDDSAYELIETMNKNTLDFIAKFMYEYEKN